LALGTHYGVIYILDFYGYEIKKFLSHTATVNELSIDANGDFISSCSDDGLASIFPSFFFYAFVSCLPLFLFFFYYLSRFCSTLAGSCATGKVVINALYTTETSSFTYKRPVKAVAVDPDYRNSRQFCTGGLAGQLVLNKKGFFATKEIVLHAGEGPIHAIKWRGSLIAWANDTVISLFLVVLIF